MIHRFFFGGYQEALFLPTCGVRKGRYIRNLCLIFLLLQILLPITSVIAAVTIAISPSGIQPNVRKVSVQFLYEFSNGYSTELSLIQKFNVKYNGVNVTQDFLEFAEFTYISSTQVKGVIEYMFAPGSYSFSSTVELQAENPVTAATTFTVPGEKQLVRKNGVMSKITEFVHLWDDNKFGPWITISDLDIFMDVLFSDEVQVYVDPSELGDSQAKYILIDYWGWEDIHWTNYERDIILAVEPESIVGVTQAQPINPKGASVLWHETIHAINHTRQLDNDSRQLTYEDDHLYIEWAENCIIGLKWLHLFDDYIDQNAITNPPDPTIASNARLRWKNFVRECTTSNFQVPEISGDAFVIPTTAQKEELKNLIGFNVDLDTVRNGYRSLGYPSEYFEETPTVSIISPTADFETTADKYEVTVDFENNTDLEVVAAGFIVNGNVLLTNFSGSSFSSTIDLVDGLNIIQAGIVLEDDRYFLSSMVTITSVYFGPICDSDHIDLCTNESDCTNASGFWWSNDTCNSTGEPTPITVLDESTILGNWVWTGTRPDNVSRGGTMNFSAGGSYTYTLVDGDGQSDNSGRGSWALSGSNLTLSFITGYTSSWSGTTTGDASSFTYNGHGNYTFTR